jgi:uncharacterized membrane protein (GlpM family)
VNDRRISIAAVLDTVAIVLFVAIGRRNHDQDPAITGTMFTAAPFLIGLAAGWLVTRAWRSPFSLITGAIVWLVTIVVGMVLRNLMFDRGTAASFVVVATLFTGASLLGWRAVAAIATRQRQSSPVL